MCNGKSAEECSLARWLSIAVCCLLTVPDPVANVLQVCFYTVGFAFAYGGAYDDGASGNRFIGYKHFALSSLPSNQYAYWYAPPNLTFLVIDNVKR